MAVQEVIDGLNNPVRIASTIGQLPDYQRADVWDFIAADNPRAAARMDELFSDAAARLADHPKLGRPGKIQ
jgi:plasmid stabilization system protein ParE